MSKAIFLALALISSSIFAGSMPSGEWQYVHTNNRYPDYPGDISKWITYIDTNSIKNVRQHPEHKIAISYVEFVTNDPRASKHKWTNHYFIDCGSRTIIVTTMNESKHQRTDVRDDDAAVMRFVCNWKI